MMSFIKFFQLYFLLQKGMYLVIDFLLQKGMYLVIAIAGHWGLYFETNSAVFPEVVIQMIAAAPMW